MKRCTTCGVEVEENLDRCPLCEAGMGDRADTERQRTGETPQKMTPAGVRLLLWEVFTLPAFAAAIVIFAADFAFGFDVRWSRYPLLSILFVWTSATIFIWLAPRSVAALAAETAAVAGFLFALEQLAPGSGWFVQLALPVTALTGVLVGAAAFIIRRMKLTVLPAVGVGLLAAGVFVVGLEAAIEHYLGSQVPFSWSLVVLACSIALFPLILLIDKRLRERYAQYRKVFHL